MDSRESFEILKYFVLTAFIVIAAAMVMCRVLQDRRVFFGILVPMWIVALFRTFEEPHKGIGVFMVCLVASYFWVYGVLYILWLYGLKVQAYELKLLFPVPTLVGNDGVYWLLVSLWYVGFNAFVRLSLHAILLSDKAGLLDKALVADGRFARIVNGQVERKYSIKNISYGVVRFSPHFMIDRESVINMMGAMEMATNERILSIKPEADKVNDFDIEFGQLKTEMVKTEQGKSIRRSSLTWDEMPRPKNKMHLMMGMSGDTPIIHPMDLFSVLFITGKPRSGKSVQLLAMLKSLAMATPNFQAFIFELQKGGVDYDQLQYNYDEWREIEHLKTTPEFHRAKMCVSRNHNVILATDLDSWSRCIDLLQAELNYRIQYLKSIGAQKMLDLPEEMQLPVIFIVFDEVLSAIITYERALRSERFVKYRALLESLYLRGGFVNIINCSVYHEITKAIAGPIRDLGLIYAFNIEQHETEHVVKARMQPPYGQGIGICRDVDIANTVRKYTVANTDVRMTQESITLSALSASELTKQENIRRQLFMYSEAMQRQIYEEIHALRMEYIHSGRLKAEDKIKFDKPNRVNGNTHDYPADERRRKPQANKVA